MIYLLDTSVVFELRKPKPHGAVLARLLHLIADTVYEDAMIAATAKVHGLTVVTRNIADFKSFGVSLLNPFKI